MAAKDDLGRYGEQLAEEYLRGQGLRVIERNWRCTDGELDLIAADGTTIVFCEVKTRSSTSLGYPIEAITPAKAARIRRLAARWLRDRSPRGWRDLRFDVVGVLAPRGYRPTVEHFAGVF